MHSGIGKHEMIGIVRIKNRLNLVQAIIKTPGTLKHFLRAVLVKPALFRQSAFNPVMY